MSFARQVARRGFRKWYERELLASHAHLVLTFLCVIGVFASFEAFGVAESTGTRLFDAGAALLCLGVGGWALRRYLYLLMHAEQAAHQAVCPTCGTYARFRIVEPTPAADELAVRCGKCDHDWRIRG